MNAANTSPSKGKKYLRYAAWSVAIAASLVTVAYVGINEYARYSMQALNCETLSSVEFDKSLSTAMSEPVYTPAPGKPVFPVHFKLDLGLSEGDDVLVRIGSAAAGSKLVYLGPYRKSFTILAGEELLNANHGDGGDYFPISIYQKSSRKIGSGGIESFRPWQANKTVHIKLLPFRELNKIGEPESFEVHVD